MEKEEIEKFNTDNFDHVQYINQIFPDEDSLKNLDDVIQNLESELESMNKELTTAIHDHAMSNMELQQEILNANSTTKEIIQEIQSIKEKASESEKLIFEMGKDIKSLDIAKNNLTFSITALRKFNMMMTAVEQLKDSCQKKIYGEVANLIEAFDELSMYFKKYQNIPQIKDLLKEKDLILKELKAQLKEDFEGYDRQSITLKSDDMKDACSVVEALGQNFKNEIIQQLSSLLLQTYEHTFRQPEYNNLDTYERRFSWLQRNLKDFEDRWIGVFPEYWAVSNSIIYEFCGLTRVSLTQILESEALKIDIKKIMSCLQVTIQFEQGIQTDMQNRFKHYLELATVIGKYQNNELQLEEQLKLFDKEFIKLHKKKGQFFIQRLPKFQGSISASFEQYLEPYVKMEQKDMINYINKVVQEQNKEEEKISDLNILNSSLYFFNYIKTLIKRSSSYSQGALMLQITEIIKEGLEFYCKQLNVIILQEEKKKKDETQFLYMVAMVINTAEYCKDNMGALEDTLIENIEQMFQEQISMTDQEECFIDVINQGIEKLQSHLEKIIDPQINSILKALNNGNTDAIQNFQEDHSQVNFIKQELTKHGGQLQNQVSEVYFIYYLNKLVVFINNKFLKLIFRLTNFTSECYTQLIADCTELEICLKQLGKLETNKKYLSYDSFVTKIFDKTKNLLKLLMMPSQSFLDNFNSLYDAKTEQDLDVIIKIKGIRKEDAQQIYQKFR